MLDRIMPSGKRIYRNARTVTKVECGRDANDGGRAGDEAEWAAAGLFLALETEGLAAAVIPELEMVRVLWRHASSLSTPLLRYNPCSRPGIVTVCGTEHSQLYLWCDPGFLGERCGQGRVLRTPGVKAGDSRPTGSEVWSSVATTILFSPPPPCLGLVGQNGRVAKGRDEDAGVAAREGYTNRRASFISA